MTTYLVLAVVAAAVSLLGMAFVGVSAPRGLRLVVAAVLAVLLFTAVVARLFEGALDEEQRPLLLLFSGVLAVCGGSLATTAAFDQVDGAGMSAAADILRLSGRRHTRRGGDRAGGQGPRALSRTEDRRYPQRPQERRR